MELIHQFEGKGQKKIVKKGRTAREDGKVEWKAVQNIALSSLKWGKKREGGQGSGSNQKQ